MCVRTDIYVHMDVLMYVCICFLRVCLYVIRYVRLCVCMYICMYV